MKKILNPVKSEWSELIERPAFRSNEFTKMVTDIISEVRTNEDKALVELTEKFDKVKLNSLVVNSQEKESANTLVSQDLKDAINIAYLNIEKFHAAQNHSEKVIETSIGVSCWRKNVAIEKVGLYIPGGSAPLFSTILMLGIPAKLAGCKEIVLCTPPNKDGKIEPAILYAASLVGINSIFKVGGAQAIAAMAFGTESIPQVYKIFGPGNQYVTKAKELIQQEGIAIDMPAGPSEVLIIEDQT